ncbi:excinuclease ABC subunit UvrA [Candidatus Peregrinibacteria bacterium]|nr:excinuclease ABC subunit UvrA [Candidatus Peregrinibacteria bacterium]
MKKSKNDNSTKLPFNSELIVVKGARLHNLKNINVEIPKNKLTVITGLSGSGKSSLAFDTIYAEGQRRYVESLSTYARQFLQLMEKPDVDAIEGLSPAISIDQKSAPRNPRSTVGTVTEIYDYLRLLFAKVGTPYDPVTNKPLTRQTSSEIVEIISEFPEGQKILLLAPIINQKKGSHVKVFEKIKKDGFVRVRVDGEILTITEIPELDENKKHTIEIVVDRLVVKNFKRIYQKLSSGDQVETPNPDRTRLADSVELSLRQGGGRLIVVDNDTKEEQLFSEQYASADSGINIPEITPSLFSFNSPQGACEHCHGLGTKLEIDPKLVIPNQNLTLAEGAIMPWSATTSHLTWYNRILESVAVAYGFSMNTPLKKLTKEQLEIILRGTGEQRYKIKMKGNKFEEGSGFNGEYNTKFEGIIPNLERRYHETDSDYIRKKIEKYMQILICPKCQGNRLKMEVLAIKVNGMSIIDVTHLSVKKCRDFFLDLKLSKFHQEIARLIVKEIESRLQFLQDVGLAYLTLDRAANTLSGGEAQRIRLATQIGSKLSGVIYVLDEPSIGLHQNDNAKLINTLISLRDLGNTVIVVEHDVDTMLASDYILDMGPGAGKNGGQVLAAGKPTEIMENPASLTGKYLSGKENIHVPKKRRSSNGYSLKIIGATEHNLKNVSVEIPLGTFIAITGVSGSGKSTLINDILVKEVSKAVYGTKATSGAHKAIEGIEHLDKIINIDQSPIGRTPRSNPATYTGVFTEIRDLFAASPEAKLRGYKSGRFSFNVKGGRCEACQGDGIKKIEMHFLPDIYVQCESCKGKRYNPETLEVTYRGKNIADVLDMSVEESLDFFDAIPNIKVKLETLHLVGLSYIKLGQQATTLSGGEAQRIKLATELSRKSTGQTLYVLDEPTTGLHFDDVKKLLDVLQKLVDKGNTVLTIEHNLDVIKSVDYIIDLGPDGGDGGGEVIATGTPEQVAKVKGSYTAEWLAKLL